MFHGHPLKDTYKKQPSFQMIHLKGDHLQSEYSGLKEALTYYFGTEVILVFEKPDYAVVILSNAKEQEEMLEEDQLSEMIMGDFLVNISIFFGRSICSYDDTIKWFKLEKELFSNAYKLCPKKTFQAYESIPYVMVENDNDDMLSKRSLISYVFAELEREEDLFSTLKIYIASNFNASLAAKRLHLHRNTLQYRLDKFIDVTGMDIKKFSIAAGVYFTLMIKESLKN
ncbi:CdaR family transcriptional regulator [Thalassobacillus sp. C254]|uniref:PucR family transcriptional regulator n=1 Tax=Thalassobacillus sp. C254 TaxID=1225341 RepID=UPI0006D0D603|nr:PucR family transcriptional regulator [Thalassobacillus sp. C254]